MSICAVFKKYLQPCKAIFVLLISALLLLGGGTMQSAMAQVGIGFVGNGSFTGTIGSNKGGVAGYVCPPGSVLRGIHHIDKAMNAANSSTRGMTSFVALYCTNISIDAGGNVVTTPVTPDGTPTVSGYRYPTPGTEATEYCPTGSVVTQMGGFDRRTWDSANWVSSLTANCRPVQVGTADWVQIDTGAGTNFRVGINESNAPHVSRGPFCAGTTQSAVNGIYRQAGGEGYDGINIYCGNITQARHSAILTFNNFAWSQTIDENNWLVDLTQNGQLLQNTTGISGAKKLPYPVASDNNTNAYQFAQEIYVLPTSGYGARVGQAPASVPANSYTQTGSCITTRPLTNQQDDSCVLMITGRPDIAVGITVPDRIYSGINPVQDITITATNLGPREVTADMQFALVAEIPAGWTPVAIPGCTVSGQTISCLLDTPLAAASTPGGTGGTVSFTFPVQTNPSIVDGTRVVNLHLDRSFTDGSGDLGITDYNTANDIASGNISYAALPALTINKITKGNTGSFNFSGTNGFGTQTITTTQADMSTRGNTVSLGALNTETTVTEELPENWILSDVSCTGLGDGSLTVNDNSFTLSPDTITETSDIYCTLTNQYVNIVTHKTSNISPGAGVQIGDTITYTLTTQVTGQSLSEDLVITDTLSAGLAFGTVTDAGSFTPNTSGAPVLNFTLPQGTAPGTYSVSYTVIVGNDATGSVSNSATTNTGDCNECTTTIPLASISTSKSSDAGNGEKVQPGQSITYTLTTVISGGALNDDLVLTDRLGNSLVFNGVTSAGSFMADTSEDPQLKFTLPAGTPEGTYTVSYTAIVDNEATAAANNAVTASSGTCNECSTTNPLIDIVSSKTADIPNGETVQIGSTITYTVTTTITGGPTTEPIILTDVISGSLIFEEVTDAGSFTVNTSNSPFEFTLPTGTTDGTYTLTYTARVRDGAVTSADNSMAASSGRCDPCLVRNPVDTSLVFAKAVANESGTQPGVAEPGEILTYEITITNKGAAVTGYELQDILDPNVEFISASNGGSYGFETPNGIVDWTGLDVPGRTGTTDGTLVLTVQARVSDPLPDDVTHITNKVKQPGAPDPVCPSDHCTMTPVERNELVLVKKSVFEDTDNSRSATPGDIIRYTFTVTNNGNIVVTDVKVSDPGPTFNGQPGENTLSAIDPAEANIEPGESATFTATYTLTERDISRAGDIKDGVRNTATASGTANGKTIESGDSGGSNTSTLTLPPATPATALTISKIANLPAIRRGEQAPFTIRLTNNSASSASGVWVFDQAPSGFRFVEGSATLNGEQVTPTINGKNIVFENLSVPGNSYIEIQLRLLALSSAGPGEHTNIAFATDPSGQRLTAEAKAKIEILMESIFDCAEIIGRVFVDDNRDGYQNKGEIGVPGVRLATARGWVITTDQHGRFNVPCAAIPNQRIGSNFILKLDPRSLPTGHHPTTENPRVVRLTAGKMTEIDFGVALDRMVQLVLKSEAFEPGESLLRKKWQTQINQLISILEQDQAVLQLRYIDTRSTLKTAEKRLYWVRDYIKKRWRQRRGSYPLEIETHVEAGR